MYDVPFDCITDYVQDMSFSSTVPFGVKKVSSKVYSVFWCTISAQFHNKSWKYRELLYHMIVLCIIYIFICGMEQGFGKQKVYYNLYTYELKSNQS